MTYPKFESDADVIAFVRSHTSVFSDAETLIVEEIGDGNINFIYRVKGDIESVIVKQALPFVRIIGDGWPLSRDRIRIEAEVLKTEGTWAPQYVPKVFAFDPDESAFIMEDVGDHENLRHAWIARHPLPDLARHLGVFLAETLFHTSDFYLDYEAKKRAVANYINPDLCKITEDLFFWDPYCDHERNSINPAVKSVAQSLWQDEALKLEVNRLKYRFMTGAEALLHGDLHAGSVFVRADSTKVIDPEFAFYGPMAFDVGSVIGNYLLNIAGQFGLEGDAQARADYQAHLYESIQTLWVTFKTRFLKRVSEKTDEPTFQSAAFAKDFLDRVWHESVSFAGTEMIRRTIGLAHVADLDRIDDDALRAKSERWAILLGREMILTADQIASPEALVALAKDWEY
jgi:5-methylthioribose kinase